jgi:hypothetical protein
MITPHFLVKGRIWMTLAAKSKLTPARAAIRKPVKMSLTLVSIALSAP